MGHFYKTKAYKTRATGGTVEEYHNGLDFCLNITNIACRAVQDKSVDTPINGHELNTLMYDNQHKTAYYISETMDEVYAALDELDAAGNDTVPLFPVEGTGTATGDVVGDLAGKKLTIKGQIDVEGGIDFKNSVVDNPLDFSKGIELYPGMGLSVTDNTLNFAVNDSSRKITFISGSLGAKIAEFSYYEGLVILNDQPIVAKKFVVDGVEITGIPEANFILKAIDATHAVWQAVPITQADFDALYLKLTGGNMTGGINWGLSGHEGHSDPDDLTQLWRWYDGTYDFGMSITTGRLNYVTIHNDNSHFFRVGGKDVAQIGKSGIIVLNDLSIIAKKAVIDGVEIMGVPEVGHALIATDATHATWQAGGVGEKGDKGDTGAQGEQGIQGEKGEKGDTGEAGTSGSATIGDVKNGFQTTDHNGWIKLDGRLISTLTTEQQTNATSLGFTTNLPDASNVVAIQNGGAMGAISGDMGKIITQANLPNIDLTSDTKGGHQHGMQACTNDQGTVGLSEMFERYPQTIWRRPATIANINNQNLIIIGYPMEPNGDHDHIISLGGSDTPIDITPKSISVNMFVFLAQ